jgi:hypothetical protein
VDLQQRSEGYKDNDPNNMSTVSTLLQFGSTLVTYLIVLLQLKFTVAGSPQRPA